MKTLIIIFITLLCFTKANAQWYKVDSNTTENIYDIFFVDKNVGYCIASDGILKSTDGGDSWNKIYINNIYRGYIVAYKDTVIAFGRNDNVFKKYISIDNGNTWENEVINYIPQFVQLSNNNVFYTDALESSTLKKLYNGIITTISDNAYVYGVNKNEIVCVNYLGNTIYKLADGGLTWETLPSFPPNVGNDQLTGAEIKSFNDIIIFVTTYPNKISFSYDNGKNWTQNSLEEGPSTTTIVNSSTLYGVDYSGIFISNLESWTLQTSLAGERMTKLYFYDDNLGFAIGENGTIIKTNNGGSLGVAESRELEKKIGITKFLVALD